MTAFRGPGVRQLGAAGTTPKEHRLAIAGGIGLRTFVKRFTTVELGESFEFTADHGSGAGGATEFSLHGRIVHPKPTTALVKSDAFALKLQISDVGTI